MPNTNHSAADHADDLDAIMREGLEQFDMPQGDEAAAPAQAAPAGPADASGRPADKSQPPAGGDDDDDAASYRFKTHSEAEKGYKNLQSEHTRIAQENAELKRSLEAREREKTEAAAREQAETEFRTYAADQRLAMLDEIDALNPDDPEYKKQVAAIQAKTDLAIFTARQNAPLSAAQAKPPVKPGAAPATEPGAATAATPQAAAPAADKDAVVAYTREKITAPDIGLAADDPLFWTFALRAPKEDDSGNTLTLDDQISWAVEQTKNYHASIRTGADPQQAQQKAEAAARERAAREQPLGRSGAARPPAEAAAGGQPAYGIADALADVREMRRIT